MINFFKRWSVTPQAHNHVTTMGTQTSFIGRASHQRPEFSRNVIVHRCVSLIAKSIASIPLLVYDNDKETSTHDLSKMLNAPNGRMNYQTFMSTMTHHFLLWGNAYIYTYLSKSDRKLVLLDPNHIEPVFNDQGYPIHYLFGQHDHRTQYACDLKKDQESVLHLKTFNPDHPWIGLSPLSSCQLAVDQHNAIGAHNVALLKNGGRPSGALIVNDNLNAVDRHQLRQDIEQLYSSPDNAGRILLLEGQFQWQELGLSPKNMDFLAGKRMALQEIATAFGISPILVGDCESACLNNYKEARLQFWEDTVIPLMHLFVGHFNFWFQKIYPTVRIDFDMDAVLALSARRQEIWEKLNTCDFLTPHEKREALGYSS